MSNATEPTWDIQYEWRAVALLSIGFGLVGLDRFMILPLFPVIMRDLRLDYQDLGNVAGVLALAWGAAAMLCGRIADHIGHRRVLVPATVVFSLLAGCSGLATGIVSLLLVRAAMGLSEGAFTPASIVATLEASKPSRHGRNLGIQQNAVALFGLGLAPIIVTQLLQVVPSWRWVFALVCVPGLLIAYLMHRVLRDKGASDVAGHVRVREAHAHKWSAVFSYRNVLLNIGGMFCWLTALTVLSALLPNYLTDHLHLNIKQMGFIMSAIGFGGSLGNLIMPGLSDRLGRKPVMITGVVLGVASLILFRGIGANVPILFGLLFVVMFCVFANITLTVGPLTVESVPPGLMTSASGLVVGVGEVFGGGVAPALGGYVAKHFGIENIVPLAATALAIGLLIALALKETAPAIHRPAQIKGPEGVKVRAQ